SELLIFSYASRQEIVKRINNSLIATDHLAGRDHDRQRAKVLLADLRERSSARAGLDRSHRRGRPIEDVAGRQRSVAHHRDETLIDSGWHAGNRQIADRSSR